MRLEGKHLVVVGGSSGIGLETARLALAAGASVTIAGRSENRLRRATENLHASPRVGQGSGGGGVRAGGGAAVEGMTRALALDLAPTRVNAVAPGLIDTPLWDAFGPQREAILASGATLPVGRIGRPEEVAEAVLFLMSNGFVTGAVLPIDGGGSLV